MSTRSQSLLWAAAILGLAATIVLLILTQASRQSGAAKQLRSAGLVFLYDDQVSASGEWLFPTGAAAPLASRRVDGGDAPRAVRGVIPADQCRVSDSHLALLRRFPDLRFVRLTNCSITDAGMRDIAACEKISILDLGGTRISDRGLLALQSMVRLTSLDVSNTRITDRGLKYIASLHHLKRLDLLGTHITNDGLAAIAALPSLKSLDLSFTMVNDVGLSSLPSLPRLETLLLQGCNVSGKGLRHLAAMPCLRQIYLMHTSIRDNDLAALEHADNLELIELYDTEVTDRGVQHLQDLLPNLRTILYASSERSLGGGFGASSNHSSGRVYGDGDR